MTTTGRHRAQRSDHPWYRSGSVAVGVTALLAATLVTPALATTTVSGGDAGTSPPVVRGNDPTITSDSGALMYFRSGTVAAVPNVAYAAQSLTALKTLALVGRLCRGNNPSGVHASPRQTITVTDPNGHVLPPVTVSPARDISIFGSGAPLSPQPAASDTNYIGDYPGTGSPHGESVTLNLAGQPAGIYTVTTETDNVTRSVSTGSGGSVGPCVVGVPDPTNGNKSVIPGPVTTSTTFEYRPWQNTFVDVFGAGKVFANTLPHEYQFSFGSATGQTGTLVSGASANMHLYAFPSTDAFLLPTSPACLNAPASCLPAIATACDPVNNCTPRIMTINDTTGAQKLQGYFDLQTKAFYARAVLNGTTRYLASTGTANDAQIGSLLAKLKAAAAAKGIDLASLLNTKIRLATGTNELDITLLQGLQIAPSSAKGVQIVSDTTVQAGVILDIYFDNVPTTCVTSSAANTSATPRYTPTVGYGYRVQKSDILPKVPSVGPVGAIASGPIFHITGKFRSTALANTASAAIGVDTAADEPNGYPIWVEPFLGSGHVNSPSTMDFLGTATWTASETNLGASCLVVDFMLGTGVAIYNNPLPVGFGTLLDPAYTPNANAEKLISKVDTAVQNVVNMAATNSTVAALLNQLVGALPT